MLKTINLCKYLLLKKQYFKNVKNLAKLKKKKNNTFKIFGKLQNL